MRNAILLTLIGVIAVSLITIGVVYALPPQTPSVLTPSGASEQTVSEDPSNYPYLLRTYEGKLAVFTDDLVQPDLVFDVYVSTLPELDQQQLSRGIRVKTYDELTSMIEDYIS